MGQFLQDVCHFVKGRYGTSDSGTKYRNIKFGSSELNQTCTSGSGVYVLTLPELSLHPHPPLPPIRATCIGKLFLDVKNDVLTSITEPYNSDGSDIVIIIVTFIDLC